MTAGPNCGRLRRVTTTEAIRLLDRFRAGNAGRDEVLRAFQAAPVADLGFAQVDTHRALRKGFPEVIFGAGKTPAQVLRIAERLLAGGTSDLPVAEEAAVTSEIMGNRVERIADVGVAGIHRLFAHLKTIQRVNVVIVVAGMEGALPSVVAGLVSRPVIAVPTSIGYGASFGGLAALLAMLNSCGSGVTVVNIDNGFGAGYAASQINALTQE